MKILKKIWAWLFKTPETIPLPLPIEFETLIEPQTTKAKPYVMGSWYEQRLKKKKRLRQSRRAFYFRYDKRERHLNMFRLNPLKQP